MPGNKKIESGKGSTVTGSASNMKWGNPVTGGRVPVCCGGHKHWDITFSEKQVDISIQSNVFGVSNSEPRAHNPRTTAQIVPPHPSVDGYPLNIPLSSSRRPYADISPLEGKESGWIYLMEGNGSCTGTYSISQFNELEYGHFSSFKEESTTQLWEVVQLSAHNSGSKTLNFNLESISPSRRVGSYNKTSCFAWLKQTGKSKLIKSEYQKSYVYANFLPLKGKEGYTGTVTNTLKQKHAYET